MARSEGSDISPKLISSPRFPVKSLLRDDIIPLCPTTLWTWKDCPWRTAFPSIMPSTHANSKHIELVLGTVSLISRKLLLKRERPLFSRKKTLLSSNRQDRCSLLCVLGRTSCYHTATSLVLDEVARPPKENCGSEITEEHWVQPVLQNFCHLLEDCFPVHFNQPERGIKDLPLHNSLNVDMKLKAYTYSLRT